MTVLPSFKLNGVSLPSPTSAQWVIPTERGKDLTGQTRYNGLFGFTLTWNLLTQTEYNLLYTTWLGHYGSGTATAQLPEYNNATYQFRVYSGCVFDMPIFGSPYDTNYPSAIKIEIRRISF